MIVVSLAILLQIVRPVENFFFLMVMTELGLVAAAACAPMWDHLHSAACHPSRSHPAVPAADFGFVDSVGYCLVCLEHFGRGLCNGETARRCMSSVVRTLRMKHGKFTCVKSAFCTLDIRMGALLYLEAWLVALGHCNCDPWVLTRSLVTLDMLKLRELAVAKTALLQGHKGCVRQSLRRTAMLSAIRCCRKGSRRVYR